jgi:23S rRNA (cytosine1962-C5)-methyltransferase
MKSNHPRVALHEGRESALRHQHPWIFSGAIAKVDAGVTEGDIVAVQSSSGQVLGFGHYAPGSIAVKMLSFGGDFSAETFLEQKIDEAIRLRSTLGLMSNTTTTGYRLINAEGDGLPGLIVDLYSSTAVVQFHSLGMHRLRERLVDALRLKLGARLTAVFNKSKELAGNSESGENGYLWGHSQSFEFQEYGIRFIADWEHGQKTGFFLDQRENRKLLASYVRGKNVLNCFSYTGGFSIYALSAGAERVTSVDTSSAAMSVLEKNITLNSFSNEHRSVTADCLHYLQKLEDAYDIIVLDPPAFVKHRGALRGGIKGYETINHLACKQIKSGGLLFTFSCSQLLSREDFRDSIVRSALRAGRRARILFELRQAPCHPVSVFHPEGDYLKGAVVEVL